MEMVDSAQNDGVAANRWSARNQLIAISGGVSANFQYDAFGRRVSKTVGPTTQFLYDGANPVQELSGTGVSANLLTGLGVDEYFQRTDGNGPANFLRDALGSTVPLTGPGGATLASYTYGPFGSTTVAGNSSNPYQFTSREDDSTGLYFYRARYYSTALQRFISEDPTEFGGGNNLYRYAGDQPLIAGDPMGTQGVIDSILNHFYPPPPPPPSPNAPPGPAMLITDYSTSATVVGWEPPGSQNHNRPVPEYAPNGWTTFYPGGDAEPISIPSLTLPQSSAKPGAGLPYCSGWGVTVESRPGAAFGGTLINTGDPPRGRDIHGGGSGLANPYAPNQPLTMTNGCTRMHNEDVQNLANAIKQYQQNNPNAPPIQYCRSQ